MHIFSDSVEYKYTPGVCVCVCVCVHALTLWHTNETFICMSNDSYNIYFDSPIQTTFVGVCVRNIGIYSPKYAQKNILSKLLQ